MSIKSPWRLLRDTGREFYNDSAHLYASAISFYILISLAPLLMVSISIAAYVLGEETARNAVFSQFAQWWGENARDWIENAYVNFEKSTTQGGTTIISLCVIFFGATRTFVELSGALDKIWDTDQQNIPGGFIGMVLNRLLAFVLVIACGLLLLVLSMLSAAVGIVAPYLDKLTPYLPFIAYLPVIRVLYWVVSWAILTLLCGVIYKVLPHRPIRWKHVWIGAMVTAALLNVGRSLFTWYLSAAGTQSVYGAAGVVIVILFGLYYSTQVFFLGAEFTHVYSQWHNQKKPGNGKRSRSGYDFYPLPRKKRILPLI